MIIGTWEKGKAAAIIGGKKEGEAHLQRYIYGTTDFEKLEAMLEKFKAEHDGNYWIEFQELMD